MEIVLSALLGVACTYIAMTELHKRRKVDTRTERKEMTEQERAEQLKRMNHFNGLMNYDAKQAYSKGGGK